MKAFVWELEDGGSIAVIAEELIAARQAALGHLSTWAEKDAPTYHKKSQCRKLRTLIESGSTPQSLSIGLGPYVFLTPSPDPLEKSVQYGDISIGSMVNSQIAIASPHAAYAQTSTGLDPNDLRDFLSTLKASADSLKLAKEDLRELQLQADTITAQLEREVPSRSIIGECLRSLRAILEGIAGNLAAPPILARLTSILSQWH